MEYRVLIEYTFFRKPAQEVQKATTRIRRPINSIALGTENLPFPIASGDIFLFLVISVDRVRLEIKVR